MSRLEAAIRALGETAESLAMLRHQRMTTDGVKEHAGLVDEAVKAAELEIYRALTALLSMDSRSPVEVGILDGTAAEE